MAKRGRPRKPKVVNNYLWDISTPKGYKTTTNAKTLIVNINRTLRQFYDTFGETSSEYQNVAKMVYDMLGIKNTSIFVSPKNTKSHPALRLSQAGIAIDYFNNNPDKFQDLQNLRKAQLNYGSAGVHAGLYKIAMNTINKAAGANYQFTKKGIRELAEKFTFYADNQADMYAYIKANGTNEEVVQAGKIMEHHNTHYGDSLTQFVDMKKIEDIYKEVIARGTPFNTHKTDKGKGGSPPLIF